VQAFWLAGAYAVLLPVLQYAWIRRAQPTHGNENAVLLTLIAIWVVVAGTARGWPDGAATCAWIVAGLLAAVAFVASLRLYRRLEVRA
jgi:hypothetical protein